MGIPNNVVILIVIIGAAATALMGYALHRLLGGAAPEDEAFNERNTEQDRYMAELRDSYRNAIMRDAGVNHREPKFDIQSRYGSVRES
ncbi:hypothetical protein H2198_000477 [Neophaeococcomyces mojaviensis]|uniref:Uncharacterized protein n=1 Tax=Neophaeococcomyces mojaviensis TaxID=3383035 RepID=A0ACC3AK23_9EURO|nr:hypothetical protein H2198_000477 [Knufia sp. JES_112]